MYSLIQSAKFKIQSRNVIFMRNINILKHNYTIHIFKETHYSINGQGVAILWFLFLFFKIVIKMFIINQMKSTCFIILGTKHKYLKRFIFIATPPPPPFFFFHTHTHTHFLPARPVPAKKRFC